MEPKMEPNEPNDGAHGVGYPPLPVAGGAAAPSGYDTLHNASTPSTATVTELRRPHASLLHAACNKCGFQKKSMSLEY
jgi:hypothetical protein